MTAERYQQIEELYHAALGRQPEERRAFLEQACAGDEGLRNEVESLLGYDERADEFIETPPDDVAAAVLAAGWKQLAVGTTLGHYRVGSFLGAGGMGEVYRAQDTRLNREVAIKVLPASFANDADRLRRFEREALATSALNHPNILTIYDIGTQDGTPYIVAELLEGEELRQQLNDVALAQHKVIDYALQVASGLAAAHSKGIIHRDLKPENIFITTDGRAKLLDFGLAKLRPAKPAAGASSELITQKASTDPGVVMGTVGYMSPEQVRGQAADHRSDIFSFGVILYEMLSGRRPFTAASAVEVMNAILKEEPEELTKTNARITAMLERIVRKCLEKKPERRFQSASDLGFALETLSTPSGSQASMAARGVGQGRNRERLAWVVAGALLVGLMAALPFATAYFRRPTPDVVAMRFIIPASEKQAFAGLSLSPDGRRLVYQARSEGKQQLWVRQMDSLTAQPLPGTDNPSAPAFWSPDGRSIGFFANGKLKKMELSGGPAQPLTDAPFPRGGSWNREGVIVFAPDGLGPLYRVSATGGEATQLTTLDESRQEVSHRWPFFLPDGRHFLYLAYSVQRENTGIYIGSLDSKEAKRITGDDSNASFSPSGYLLFSREGALMAQPFDADKLQVTAEAFPVVERIQYSPPLLLAGFSVSNNGVLAYLTGNPLTSQLTWFDRSGKKLGTVGRPGSYAEPRLSPDEKRVAVAHDEPPEMAPDIWLIELARGIASRLTSDPADDLFPVWSPDGSRIAFSSSRDGTISLYQNRSSGAGGDEALLKSREAKFMMDWSANGRYILYVVRGGKTRNDLWVLPLFGDRKPYPLLPTEFNEEAARFSPDGRWVAYSSDETGTQEVYVREFQESGRKWRVSTGGGSLPGWRRDGKELFYISGENLMAVEVKEVGANFEASVPRLLFAKAGMVGYDVSRDGQRFLVGVALEEGSTEPIAVVLNWTADLKR